MNRFLAGLGAGITASGITCLVTAQPPWWWLIGLVTALFVWTGELFLDFD